MDNFNLKKYLVENKATYNSRLVEEEKIKKEAYTKPDIDPGKPYVEDLNAVYNAMKDAIQAQTDLKQLIHFRVPVDRQKELKKYYLDAMKRERVMYPGLFENLSEVETSTEINPTNAVEKAVSLVPKLEKSSEITNLATKIANDPKMMQQLEKALQKGGITMSEAIGELDLDDAKKIALTFATQASKIKNEEKATWDDVASGAIISSFVGGGLLGAHFSKAIGSIIPALKIGTAPATAGAVAGVSLVILARLVYKLLNKEK